MNKSATEQELVVKKLRQLLTVILLLETVVSLKLR